jgi:hypothetical protein
MPRSEDASSGADGTSSSGASTRGKWTVNAAPFGGAARHAEQGLALAKLGFRAPLFDGRPAAFDEFLD